MCSFVGLGFWQRTEKARIQVFVCKLIACLYVCMRERGAGRSPAARATLHSCKQPKCSHCPLSVASPRILSRNPDVRACMQATV